MESAPRCGARLLLALALATGLTLPGSAAAAAQLGRAHFDAGVAAYRDGRYEDALAAFTRARGEGLDIPNLHFNLGLAAYRLGRYPEARAAFERLRGHAGYHDIAEYHLGLVAAREGDDARAAGHWRRVRQDAAPALRRRAEVALARLDPSGPAAAPGLYLMLGAGHDSNPALLDEDVQAEDGGSGTLEGFGAFDRTLSGGAAARTAVRGGFYVREYLEDNGLAQAGLFAGLARERRDDRRRRGLSVDAGLALLDGERFTTTLSATAYRAPARPGIGTGWSAQAAQVSAAEPYAHLDGLRLRGEVEHGVRLGAARARAGYQLEYNDRDDLDTGAEFFSYSPLRHRATVTLDHPLSRRWLLQWTLRYRYSRHPDADRFDDNGTAREVRREESLRQAGLRARRLLGGGSNLLLEYQYSRNTSTIDAYGYDRHVVLVGWEWLPAR